MDAPESASRSGMRGGSRPKYGEGITRQIADAYMRGQTIREVAENFECGEGTVWRALGKHGVARRRQGLRKATIVVPTDPATIGYIAGLLDGEGNLQFRGSARDATLAWRLTIYSTTRPLIEWLEATVGGKVRWARREHKPLGSWTVYRARDVEALLRVLLPHLIVKREVAVTFLAMFDAADHAAASTDDGNS